MMKNELTLSYSPCPNDTFIFHAMTHCLIDTEGLSFRVIHEDVETLNQNAVKGRYDITKLSTAAYAHLRGRYALLNSGAALGRGCGPLIVKRKGVDPEKIEKSEIAVPGLMTTAFALLSFYLGKKPETSVMGFEKIMPAIISGVVDFGVIIHEGRFTYKAAGLELVADLGEWWEKKIGLPIPLGCIAISKDLEIDYADKISRIIERSIRHAFENPDASMQYIKMHAQELEDSVIEQHIRLYVNDFSLGLGDEGLRAIDAFVDKGRDVGFWD